MIIENLELYHFRNYDHLSIQFDKKTNVLFGDNAQGKTNILEAIYLSSTTKSHKGSKDKDMISFDQEESYVHSFVRKNEQEVRIDIELRKSKNKAIAINGQKISKAAELLGILNVVFFSPEDLGIVKNGPTERRRFIDMELCQLDKFYLYNLTNYNKTILQRNQLLKELYAHPELRDTLPIWDKQLISYGSKIIERRRSFINQLNDIIYDIHTNLTGNKEKLLLSYEPNCEIEEMEKKLAEHRERDIRMKLTSVGPHRDDFLFMVNGIDVRIFGSQGQQRTAALSLKLSEIEVVRKMTGDTPVLLLDDVLSELDSSRQKYLLQSIGDLQTIITCTGLEEFVHNSFEINKVFHITSGKVVQQEEKNEC